MSTFSPQLEARTPRSRRWRVPARPSIAVHMRALRSRRRLDDALALGADPHASRELALRGCQLTGRRHREMLAGALEKIVTVVDRNGSRPAAVPRAAAREVRGPVDAHRARAGTARP